MSLFLLFLFNVGTRLADWAERQRVGPYQFIDTLRVWNPKVPS